MRYGLVNQQGHLSPLVDKCKDVLEIEEATLPTVDWVIVESSGVKIDHPKVINTCPGASALAIDKTVQEQVKELLNISSIAPVSYIYGLFNGEIHSPVIEVALKTKMMSGDIGVDVPFSNGVGVVPAFKPEEAFVGFPKVMKFLKDIQYHGEFLIPIGEEFRVCGLYLGHHFGAFAMYDELLKSDTQTMLEFMSGVVDKLELWDNIVLAGLVSLPPWPFGAYTGRIKAPVTAEKHIHRVGCLGSEVCVVITHGLNISQAKRRLFRTYFNMIKHCPTIQYRNDIGFLIKFQGSQEKFEQFIHPPHREEGKKEFKQGIDIRKVQTKDRPLLS